jgi:outer membrane receptor protein involved in Fe transport
LFENQASTGLRLFTAPTLFERHGVSGDLAWQTKRQTLVLGAESETDRFKQEFDVTDPMTQKTYALYMNDSVTVGDLNVTAGLRYDFFDPVGGIASPSLGATYLASRDLLFRALVTRGFHSPAIVRSFDAPTVGYFAGNHLAPEKIWSYQAGVEGNIVDLLRAKVTLFYHDIDDILIEKHLDSSSFTLVNGGSAKSTGGEFEFATNPCKGFAFRTGVHYERIKPIDFSDPVYFDTRDVFGVDAAFVYDGRRGLTGAVKAHYLRWDLPASTKAASKGVVVDVSAAKKLLDTGMVDLELFASGHNVFNASSYTDFSERNPGRWLEIGARCTF